MVDPDMATARMPLTCRTMKAAEALVLNAYCFYLEYVLISA